MNVPAFKTLAAIDVSRFVEKKGQFSYLSWPYAVAQLRLADPEATWAVMRFDGLPYLLTDLGYFVEVAVTVQGLTLSQIHPVLDAKNRPIAQPTTFDINTSIQRSLVKAIALHGLGLNVYAGEDLPMDVESDNLREGPTKPAEPEPEPVRPVPTKLTSLSDRRESGRGTTHITANQRRYIERLIAETDTNVDALLDYFGYESLDEIPRGEASRVISALEQRRRAA
jgi:hypothetical protein